MAIGEDSGREVARNRETPTERLVAFSDAVFAVIITIMVLDLKPPAESKLSALLPLWPTALSYAVSYLFLAIIWINHHRLLLFAHDATPKLIWWNFAHLFMISLIPFATAWISATRLAAGPVFVYAAVSSASEVRGIGAAITRTPSRSRRRMTSFQLEPSAHAP